MKRQAITMHINAFGWLANEDLIEWLTRCDRRPNLMIVAPGDSMEEVTAHVLAACQRPILPSVFPGRLQLPVSRHGTLLLQNVNAMSIPQQIVLNDWIDRRGDTQIVSMTPTGIWQLVQCGDFLESLFYRLNVIRLDAAFESRATANTESGEQYELPHAQGRSLL